MKLKLIAATLLAGIAFSASAADYSKAITLNTTYDFGDKMTPLDGGIDTIDFTGIGAGTYKVVLSYSANFLQFDSITLNTIALPPLLSTPEYTVGVVTLTTGSPFELVLKGTANALSSYSGHITVTAVPEPATYGMMLGGLGLLGLAARRKKQS